MTKEEAIQILADLIDSPFLHTWEKQNKALHMAIEALKTEPIRCGECENYIDSRCIEVNHHVAACGNCMEVFGAKRREL